MTVHSRGRVVGWIRGQAEQKVQITLVQCCNYYNF